MIAAQTCCCVNFLLRIMAKDNSNLEKYLYICLICVENLNYFPLPAYSHTLHKHPLQATASRPIGRPKTAGFNQAMKPPVTMPSGPANSTSSSFSFYLLRETFLRVFFRIPCKPFPPLALNPSQERIPRNIPGVFVPRFFLRIHGPGYILMG